MENIWISPGWARLFLGANLKAALWVNNTMFLLPLIAMMESANPWKSDQFVIFLLVYYRALERRIF